MQKQDTVVSSGSKAVKNDNGEKIIIGTPRSALGSIHQCFIKKWKMETSEFVNKLGSLAVDEVVLRNKGLGDHAFHMCRAFYPAKTQQTSSNSFVVIRLVEEYDCSEITLISSISFENDRIETHRFLQFGWVFGEDPLAVDKTNGEIVSLPYWDFESVGLYCASSGENFLKAFLIGGIVALDISFENEDARNSYNEARAEAAAIAAGGEKYRNFWMHLYITDFGTTESNNGALLN
jgi:hypothetical protein